MGKVGDNCEIEGNSLDARNDFRKENKLSEFY